MNNNEIWKQTKYDNYLVSNYGRVMSKGDKENRYKRNTDKILSPTDNGHGYLFINIHGKQVYIHRLVAEAFIPNPNNYPQINHKNENKSDNSVDNLEWCTASYNVSYTISIKVKQINPKTKEVIQIYDSANKAAKAVNGNNTSILKCCKRIKYNTYKGYIWRFINDNDYTIKNNNFTIVRINKTTKEEVIYKSVKEAAKNNKVSIYTIYNCLKGKSKCFTNYDWFKR